MTAATDRGAGKRVVWSARFTVVGGLTVPAGHGSGAFAVRADRAPIGRHRARPGWSGLPEEDGHESVVLL